MIHDQLAPPPARRPILEPALPLINVVFLLLIFFMMAGQVAEDHDVDAPRSEVADVREDPELRTLVLHYDGSLDTRTGTLPPEELGDWFRREPEAPLRLLADGSVPLEQLRPVLAGLRQAGADEVRVVTRRPD